jgi:hypothetical protein
MSLFAKAENKAVSTTAKAKKSEKPQVHITAEFFMVQGMKRAEAEQHAQEFEANMKKWAEYKAEMANMAAQTAIIESDVKRIGRQAFNDKYTENKRRPDNFEIITKGKEASAQFITQDNYPKLTKEQAEAIEETYGNGIIEVTTAFKFNDAYLAEWGEQISAAIEKAKVPTEVKENLIVAEKTFKIAKGTIDRLHEYGNPSEVYAVIQPIVQVKDVKIIE